MDRIKLGALWEKYRYVLLVALAGLVLMLLPGPREETAQEPGLPTGETLEQRLEAVLGRIQGAGDVAVLLTQARDGEVLYQTEGEDGRTILVTGADRSEAGLVRTTLQPQYQGAVVVCQGADSAAVRLAVVQAVANATGLGTDRIAVLKME